MALLAALFLVGWPLLPSSLYHQLFGLLFFAVQSSLVAFGAHAVVHDAALGTGAFHVRRRAA